MRRAFAPAGLHGRPKRHAHSHGCRTRCIGRLRPRLSATVRAIAFIVPEVSRFVSWLAAFRPLEKAGLSSCRKTFTTDDVTICVVPPTPVAIMEHRGDPATLGATIQRFIAWRTAAGLHPRTSPTFNVWRSERRPASPADYSVDLCVGTDQPIEANGERIKAGEIPGGRCALLRVVRDTEHLSHSRALPLSRLASGQRRVRTRLPDLLPTAELLPGGAGA